MALIPLYEARLLSAWTAAMRMPDRHPFIFCGADVQGRRPSFGRSVGAVNAADRDAENGVQPTRELEALRSTCRVAILYALGYLYEHRDEADHKQLMLTLRSILFAVREGVF